VPQYYAWNDKAIRLSERWRMRRSIPQFVLASIGRKLGMTAPGSPRLRPEVIERIGNHELPLAVRSRFIQSIDEMKQWQLQFCFFHRAAERVLDRRDQGVGATFIGLERTFWAGLAWVRVERAPVVAERSMFQCVTPLSDGGFLTTTNYRQRLELPPGRKVECLQNADPQLVIAAHRRRLESLEPSGTALLMTESLESHMLAYAQQFFDHMVARRMLIPVAGPAPESARA